MGLREELLKEAEKLAARAGKLREAAGLLEEQVKEPVAVKVARIRGRRLVQNRLRAKRKGHRVKCLQCGRGFLSYQKLGKRKGLGPFCSDAHRAKYNRDHKPEQPKLLPAKPKPAVLMAGDPLR
jgi:hypothetical protein